MQEDRNNSCPENGAALTVSGAEAGCRVDALMARLVPGTGVRGRRRLLKSGLVLLNGRPAKAGCFVRCGDRLEIAAPQEKSSVPSPAARCIAQEDGFRVFYKPPLLHTAALAGSTEGASDSLEGQIAGMPGMKGCSLLQRLDFATSGLVCGAIDAASASLFREAEREGRVRKYYVCLLEGRLEEQAEVRKRIVSGGKGTVRVLAEDDSDPVRTTSFYPLLSFAESEFLPGGSAERAVTLAGCVIGRGFRHQIRAHAASLDFPLYGDVLYGGRASGGSLPFYLHHGCLVFGGMTFSVFPEWELASFVQKKACAWFTECAGKR